MDEALTLDPSGHCEGPYGPHTDAFGVTGPAAPLKLAEPSVSRSGWPRSVRVVVCLIFTEGYLASGDEPSVRADLCDEAIWLARQLHRLGPDPETTGLLALLLLQNARAAARRDADGRLVPYGEQDRTLWDADAVEQAKRLLATKR